MKTKVILNPYANRWRSQQRGDEVRKALDGLQMDYDMVETAGPEDGERLAYQAAQEGYDQVVAAGGDGSINEVVNGLVRAAGVGRTLPLGIFPLGTANDFYTMAGLPGTLLEAAQVIAQGKPRLVDIGQVNDRYFINNSAVAMEPMVTLENIRMKRLSGEIRYVVALIKAIAKLKAWQMAIEWDGGNYDGPIYLLSVCNSPQTGGFTMAPGALIDDGYFDMLFAPEVSKMTVLSLLMRLMQGKLAFDDRVTFTRTKKIRISSQPGTPVHSDGEVFSESLTEISYTIHPGKVPLLSP